MRVITGTARGRRLKELEGMENCWSLNHQEIPLHYHICNFLSKI